MKLVTAKIRVEDDTQRKLITGKVRMEGFIIPGIPGEPFKKVLAFFFC